MTMDSDVKINGRLDICGLEFAAEVGPHGIRRLVLPLFEGGVARVLGCTTPSVTAECGDDSGRAVLEEAGIFIAEMLAGRPPRSMPAVDLSRTRGFTRRALEVVSRVPWGSVVTYSEVASDAGAPRGARAAGQAMASNPVPLLVPCHRVVRSDGTIGGWSGAEGWKEWLLELEGHGSMRALRPTRTVLEAV